MSDEYVTRSGETVPLDGGRETRPCPITLGVPVRLGRALWSGTADHEGHSMVFVVRAPVMEPALNTFPLMGAKLGAGWVESSDGFAWDESTDTAMARFEITRRVIDGLLGWWFTATISVVIADPA